MIRVSTIKELTDHFSRLHFSPIGFVPTMGALHAGHISLVKAALSSCPVIAVSIFVNPLQFNDKEDLKNYPRTLDKDLGLLEKVLRENDIVFTPEVKEIFPREDKITFRFGNLNTVMEGVQRPGHFNGVVQVVSRLFDIVKPDLAYFGQKDFQQLTIIKSLVRQTNNKVRIISCPIIREINGLAMSSRNQMLGPEIREQAGIIFRTLSQGAAMGRNNEINLIGKYVNSSINNTEGFITEYFEIVDEIELIPLKSKSEVRKGIKYFGCIAVKAGKIRLIDNIEISLL